MLALTGGNRRTADVRSKGFSQLFILSKNDFEEAMSDYPEAQKILKKRARYTLVVSNVFVCSYVSGEHRIWNNAWCL